MGTKLLMSTVFHCEGNTDDKATTKRQARRLELIKEYHPTVAVDILRDQAEESLQQVLPYALCGCLLHNQKQKQMIKEIEYRETLASRNSVKVCSRLSV
jgi:hypothetical protein